MSKLSFERVAGEAGASKQETVHAEQQAPGSSTPDSGHERGQAQTPGSPPDSSSSGSSSSSALDTPQGSSSNVSMGPSAAWAELEETHGSRDVVRSGPQSLGQSRLYFSSEYLEDADSFNCTASYRLSGPLDVPKLAKALSMVMDRHDIFRTRFYTEPSTGRAVQAVVGGPPRFKLKVLEGRDDAADVRAEFRRINEYPFDLAAGDTMVASLLCHGAQSHTLVFGYHHIILDGVSWQLFLQDLGAFYRGDASRAQDLGAPGQCIDFAEKQRRDMDSGAYAERLDYWRAVFPEPPAPLPLFPFAKVGARRALRRYRMRERTVSVDARLIGSIKRAGVASRTTPFHVWLAGFQVLLHRLLDTADFCVGIVDANRADAAFGGTIGFLLEIMPVRFSVGGDEAFSDVLRKTRAKTYSALARSGVPMEELA